MKGHIFSAVALIALALSGCAESGGSATMPAGSDTLDANAQGAVRSVIEACPGLQHYTQDWTLGEVGASTEGTGVEVVIAENPTVIPANFYGQGQRCYFTASAAGARSVTVSKRACISVCQDKRFEGPPPPGEYKIR